MALLTTATQHRSVMLNLFQHPLELFLLIGVILKQVQDDVPIMALDDLE